MNKKANGVWKAAFKQHPDLPTCPPHTTEREWAFMLFGPGICRVNKLSPDVSIASLIQCSGMQQIWGIDGLRLGQTVLRTVHGWSVLPIV
jgi:hypothetical protein